MRSRWGSGQSVRKDYRSRVVRKVLCKGRVRTTDSGREVKIKEVLKGASDSPGWI